MAKIRVKIDLMKPLIHSVWIGTEDENDPLRGYAQKIKYENIPKYCIHYKKLGHAIIECRVLKKKKEIDKKKAERMMQHDTSNIEMSIEPVKETTLTENQGNQGKYGNQDTRRKQTFQKDQIRTRPRGRSEPPKMFKPTGAVFGIDKPLPDADNYNKKGIQIEKDEETNAEVVEHIEITEIHQQNKQIEVIQDTSCEQRAQNNEVQQPIEGETNSHVDRSSREEGRTDASKGNHHQKEHEKRHVILMKDSNELKIDLFGGKWEEIGRKSAKKNSSKKNGSPRKYRNPRDENTTITQNSFDELMEEAEEINAKEDNTSVESEDMEEEEDDEEDDSEQEEEQKTAEK
ncbi:uncharacterized protein LOC132034802 [Lycium ferocissimum]|uniref:uncharacterized protein LOC132034802 n=1 Tax=Lycium ferocissimum TaxID=112874 RepID=UPI0028168DFC|nr:uncharacterized protein LOC132034802 [Lycium ferocissimum]